MDIHHNTVFVRRIVVYPLRSICHNFLLSAKSKAPTNLSRVFYSLFFIWIPLVVVMDWTMADSETKTMADLETKMADLETKITE
jgi:hypothetical protein